MPAHEGHQSPEERRKQILEILSSSQDPVTASSLAARFGISRQVIVGDIAILRASGHFITPTPSGYTAGEKSEAENISVIACRHNVKDTRKELYAIVDNGGHVLDVTVEHPIYGEIRGTLDIASRYDADKFCESLEKSSAATLSSITDGIHLHKIKYRDSGSLARIKEALSECGVLL